MRVLFCIFLFFSIIFTTYAEEFQKNNELLIEEMFPLKVNNLNQWLLIRGKDLSKPVILYLHGGPGQSLIPFAHVATGKLVNDFIVVYWDQRGAGLSYSDNIPPETMNINQFINDTRVVTKYLKERFKKDKIYILGHSWGTTLGTLVVQKYPEDYSAYIGVGQVVNHQVQSREGVEWLKNKLINEGTPKEKKIIKSMEENNFAPRSLLSKYGGVVHNIPGRRLAIIMRQSPYYPEKYTNELYDRGVEFAHDMWQNEAIKVNFIKEVPTLQVPVYFFLGRYDYVTPTNNVIEYYNVLKAPYKQVIWFEKSGHRMDVEEPIKFQNMIIEISKKSRIMKHNLNSFEAVECNN
jgi:pimeloyl-ACP methyl ester carboxylesterase